MAKLLEIEQCDEFIKYQEALLNTIIYSCMLKKLFLLPNVEVKG